MQGFLSKEQVKELRNELRIEDKRKYADRIRVILLLDKGWTYQKISEALFLDEGSITNNLKRYNEGGIEGLILDFHQGGTTKLTSFQEQELATHLENKIYTATKEIIFYVRKTYKVKFTLSGMRDLLHRIGFSYKKPKVVPGKMSQQKQEEFIKFYQEIKENMEEGDKIYFADAAHPHHNATPSYGWIKKGEEKKLLSNTGRQRVNLNGALDIQNLDVIVNSEDTINRASMIRLFENIRMKNMDSKNIYIILDNAAYNRSYEVQFHAYFLGIKLMYLPSYSPNLNIIERLWKFFYKKVKNNKYYPQFDDFKGMV
jgi:transposase